VLKIAGSVPVEIPDASHAMESFLDEYETSELAVVHQRFYRQLEAREAFLPAPAPEAPPCVKWLLDHPNDWLLKPVALQHVTRVLTAQRWSAPSIVQLICASYCSDCGWGDTWVRLDPCYRAIFYTRLFTGMIATGADKLIDLNCVSHREKGYCTNTECYSNLIQYRDALLGMRRA